MSLYNQWNHNKLDRNLQKPLYINEAKNWSTNKENKNLKTFILSKGCKITE